MERPDLIEVLINWFPMLLLIGLWFLIMRRYWSGKYSKYQREYMDLTKRQVSALERIAAALEKDRA